MEISDNLDLEKTVKHYVCQQFSDAEIERVIIREGYDFDDDEIVDVVIVLRVDLPVASFSKLARNLWSELSKQDFGFPILSFRTSDENKKLIAAA